MKIKAIFHIDENEKWTLLIGNVRNLYKGIHDQEYEIEILANSVAVEMFKADNSVHKRDFEELNKLGIRMCACNNSLIGMNIQRSELLPFVNVVPIGVKELIEKQLDGFAYIKP